MCALVLPAKCTLLASAGPNRVLRLWDPVSGEQLGHTLAGHAGRVTAACSLLRPDDHTAATASEDRTVLA
jgi:WD40 repeat protein